MSKCRKIDHDPATNGIPDTYMIIRALLQLLEGVLNPTWPEAFGTMSTPDRLANQGLTSRLASLTSQSADYVSFSAIVGGSVVLFLLWVSVLRKVIGMRLY